MLNWAMTLIVTLQAPPPDIVYTYSIDLFRSRPESPYTFSTWSLWLVSRGSLDKKLKYGPSLPLGPAWLVSQNAWLAWLASHSCLCWQPSTRVPFRPLLLPTPTAAAGHQPPGQRQ